MSDSNYWDPKCPAGQHDDPDFRSQHFDPYSPDLTRGRFLRVSTEMLSQCPMAHSDKYEDGFWTVARYKDIESVHQDPVSYSSFPVTTPPFGNVRPMIPLESDPPLHKDYRRGVSDQLSRAAQNAKSTQYRAFAREYIDAFIDRGECDVSKELCSPLALRALMDALGVPEEDRHDMEDIGNRLVRKSDEAGGPAQAALDLYAYFTGLIARRREDPQDDIVTVLTQAEIDGKPLTQIEILDYCMVLVPAGFETTASSMSYMFLLLAERPELQDRLRAQPQLIPSALEEMLRYVTPVRSLTRTVMTDIELAGQPLRRGDRVHLNWVAANHDPEVFDSPEEIDIERRPNRHMGFGLGAHLCLGIHMARTEMKVAFEETLARLANIRLADPDKVVEESGTTWSISSLPIQFDRIDAGAQV
jgi:cytochrome P450